MMSIHCVPETIQQTVVAAYNEIDSAMPQQQQFPQQQQQQFRYDHSYQNHNHHHQQQQPPPQHPMTTMVLPLVVQQRHLPPPSTTTIAMTMEQQHHQSPILHCMDQNFQQQQQQQHRSQPHQFACLYTKQKTQKRKVWSDGRLVIVVSNGTTNSATVTVTLYAADPPPGMGDPPLDQLELVLPTVAAVAVGLLVSSLPSEIPNRVLKELQQRPYIETEHYLMTMEGPWCGRSSISSMSTATATATSLGQQAPSTKMQRVMTRKFQKPSTYVPPPQSQRSAVSSLSSQRKRPLQPGELIQHYYGTTTITTYTTTPTPDPPTPVNSGGGGGVLPVLRQGDRTGTETVIASSNRSRNGFYTASSGSPPLHVEETNDSGRLPRRRGETATTTQPQHPNNHPISAQHHHHQPQRSVMEQLTSTDPPSSSSSSSLLPHTQFDRGAVRDRDRGSTNPNTNHSHHTSLDRFKYGHPTTTTTTIATDAAAVPPPNPPVQPATIATTTPMTSATNHPIGRPSPPTATNTNHVFAVATTNTDGWKHGKDELFLFGIDFDDDDELGTTVALSTTGTKNTGTTNTNMRPDLQKETVFLEKEPPLPNNTTVIHNTISTATLPTSLTSNNDQQNQLSHTQLLDLFQFDTTTSTGSFDENPPITTTIDCNTSNPISAADDDTTSKPVIIDPLSVDTATIIVNGSSINEDRDVGATAATPMSSSERGQDDVHANGTSTAIVCEESTTNTGTNNCCDPLIEEFTLPSDDDGSSDEDE